MSRFFWYGTYILQYLNQMAPCVFLAAVGFVLVSPWRKKRLTEQDQISGRRREGLLFFFVIFCAGLAALTVFPAGLWTYLIRHYSNPSGWTELPDLALFYPSWEEIMAETDYRNLFNPFQEIYRGLTAGPWVFFMLLGNIVMFIPLGCVPALLWKKPTVWKTLLCGVSVSGTIEFVQFFIGRSTDIDDILLNTFGTLIGYWIFCLARFLFPEGCAGFRCHKRGEGLNGTFS